MKHGGDVVAKILQDLGVQQIFTLSGGHISPILVGCNELGIKVIDVRDEATTVFAADATARLSGIPGVAVVTAGPGVTNTLTGLQNALLAESPLVLLGGAVATVLHGRGALQDINHVKIVKPHVKWAARPKSVRQLSSMLIKAFQIAQSGVPGPVFLEIPLDLQYQPDEVRRRYGFDRPAKNLVDRLVLSYLHWQYNRIFKGWTNIPATSISANIPQVKQKRIDQLLQLLATASKPLMVVGSQVVLDPQLVPDLVKAIETLSIPVYLSGMARGLLRMNHPLQLHHHRKKALREADVIILLGTPMDFRLDYGRQINRHAKLVSISRDRAATRKNSMFHPIQLPLHGDPCKAIIAVSDSWKRSQQDASWLQQLQQRDSQRQKEIHDQAQPATVRVNPLAASFVLEDQINTDSYMIADGGDWIATISYIVQPRGPLHWLNPGVFGTLGSGAGFAIAAKLLDPAAEVWLFYGDGSAGYTLMEFDTMSRHGLGVIAVVGNDASWAQIAREQVELLGDDVATVLDYSNYHVVAEGLGGKGLLVTSVDDLPETLRQAKAIAKEGIPVLVNIMLEKSDFRKGSISM